MQWPASALPCAGQGQESRPLLGVRCVEVGQEVREIPHLLYVVQVPGIEHDQGDVEIIVYNRAILLFRTDSEAVRRNHQVCCRLDDWRAEQRGT